MPTTNTSPSLARPLHIPLPAVELAALSAKLRRRTHWGTALIAAAEEQVDSTPMEGFDPNALDEILGLKARGLRSVAILPLGYRADEGDWLVNLKKVRRAREDFVTEVN